MNKKNSNNRFFVSPGHGTRVFSYRNHISISAVRAPGFTGAFSCHFNGGKIQVGFGLINEFEPLIGKRPISGRDKNGDMHPDGPPYLTLDIDEYDSEGRSWICIEVTVDDDGRIIVDEDELPSVKIVQRSRLTSADDKVGLHAIALLYRPEKESLSYGTLHQIAYFDYQHRVSRNEEGRFRHYFNPQ